MSRRAAAAAFLRATVAGGGGGEGGRGHARRAAEEHSELVGPGRRLARQQRVRQAGVQIDRGPAVVRRQLLLLGFQVVLALVGRRCDNIQEVVRRVLMAAT